MVTLLAVATGALVIALEAHHAYRDATQPTPSPNQEP
jgi:heme A synthase